MANHPIEVYVNACDIEDGSEITITIDQKVRLMVEVMFKVLALYLFLFAVRLLIPTFNQFLLLNFLAFSMNLVVSKSAVPDLLTLPLLQMSMVTCEG